MKRDSGDIPQSGQKRSLRVLLVEDSEFDAELLVRYLDSHDWSPTYSRVASQTSMEQALDRQEWDVVLCDFQMPGFGVAPAMEILRSRGLDLPFIVVSGWFRLR